MNEERWNFMKERFKLDIDKSNTYYECLLNVLKDIYEMGYVDGLNHDKPMYEVDYEKFFDPNVIKNEYVSLWEKKDDNI